MHPHRRRVRAGAQPKMPNDIDIKTHKIYKIAKSITLRIMMPRMTWTGQLWEIPDITLTS